VPSAIQRSFSGGEIAPSLYARVDQSKYYTGLRTCRNFIVMRGGGVTNRPGSEFITEVKDSTKAVRLIRFAFNSEQTYVLEFGHEYMRVIRAGVQIESGGNPYEIVTPYQEDDLADLQYVQSGDVVTIVHQSYAPRELRRAGHDSWTLEEISFEPSIDRPTGITGTNPNNGSTQIRYAVTAVKEDTYEESLVGAGAEKTITGATKANPVVITCTGHGFATNDVVRIKDVGGMVELNGNTYTVTVINANSFSLNGVNGTGYTTYTSGGKAWSDYVWASVDIATAPSSAAPITVSWTAVAGAVEYNIYRTKNGVYGFVGTVPAVAVGNPSFVDDGVEPDTTDTPPVYRNPFESAYPGAVAYTQQRLAFGATEDQPEKIWLSQTGNFHNFNIRSPIQDDDAVTFSVAGRQVNAVRHLFEVGRLVVLTSGGEWTADGDADGVLRPTAINLRQQGYSGASRLAPILIGNSALYVQARGSVIRDLRYDLESDGYAGKDLTVFADHLFDGYSIVDWDFAQIPHSVVWAVRNDGALLGLTYIREHDVWGWHRHDTSGLFENVCVVPEGDEDAVYVVVKRMIDGASKRYIERFKSRRFAEIADAFFVDSGLSYDGRNTDAGRTVTLTGGTTWTPSETLTLTCSASYFQTSDVGNEVHLTVGADTLRCRITARASGTQVSVRAHKDVATAFRGVAISDFAMAVDQVSGLDHLEGETVSILADGNVDPQRVVESGAITLSRHYAVIHAGLPIEADIETLSMDNPNGETLTDKRKLIGEVSLMVESSRGVLIGTDENHLTEHKQRSGEGWDKPVEPATRTIKVNVSSSWDDNGRVFVRQSDPLPLTVLAIVPSGVVSGSR
jgi:hypothetical protein